MNPIYRFMLSIDGENALQAFPVYKDDLAIDYEHESGYEFFRGKFSGKLTFVGNDYMRIVSASFDAEFGLQILISYDAGQTWESYWTGHFWKTDCDFNGDDETAIVTPTLKDRYNDVLAGLDKEYNLIDLRPEISLIRYDKRPMLQVYVLGQTVVGCFLSGMWWEQECEAENDTQKLEEIYHFAFNKAVRQVSVTQMGTPTIPDFFVGDSPESNLEYNYASGGYIFNGIYDQSIWFYRIIRASDNVVLWAGVGGPTGPISLVPDPTGGATGNVEVFISDLKIYARYITDVDDGSTQEIPAEDIVENNRNYKRVIGTIQPNSFSWTDRIVATPTEFGIYQPGQYYATPDDLISYFPVARGAWGRVSIWYHPNIFEVETEREYRKGATLKDAYPLWSVISVLLGKIAPGVTHEGTAVYSEFLYGTTNPLVSYLTQTLFITQKSNIINSGYDQPAQKAPITLKYVLDMLKNCFRCYWFIDEQNRFRIEHIAWFMRGGTYASQEPQIGINLTEEIVTRNGKPWSYARNQYKFDKPEMAARYQFKWMDDVTDLFDGEPIDIISKYVNPDNIEEISVQQFTSDIDYILLNPSEISKDGFVLLGAIRNNLIEPDTEYVSLPRYKTVNGLIAGALVSIKFAVNSSIQGEELSMMFFDSDYRILSTLPLGIIPLGVTVFSINASVPSGAYGLFFNTNGTMTMKIDYILNGYELPYVSFVRNGVSYNLQNARVAFISLQQFYKYDMPAKRYRIGEDVFTAIGIKKLKTQEINFPVLHEPDLFNLIKTELGDGAIQKMSVNLSSRNAKTTLKYDTE